MLFTIPIGSRVILNKDVIDLSSVSRPWIHHGVRNGTIYTVEECYWGLHTGREYVKLVGNPFYNIRHDWLQLIV